MKTAKILITSLFAAAATSVVPAFGDNVTYTGGNSITNQTLGSYTLTDTITMGTTIADDSPSQNLGSMTAGGNFYPGAYTLMFWLNAESLPSSDNITLFTYGGSSPTGNDGSNALTLNSNGTLSFGQGKTTGASFTFGTSTNRVQTTSDVLSAGTTYHIALVNNGGDSANNRATLYVNGVAALSNVTVNLNMAGGNASTVFSNLNLASASGISYGDAWLYAGASTPDTIQKLASHTSYNLTWAGNASGNWNTTDTNWTKEGASGNVAFGAYDSVTFNTPGDIAVAVDSAGVIAKTLTVSAGTVSFTGGMVTASDGVFIEGAGADSVATLKLSSAPHLTAGTVFTVGANGVLDINGRSDTVFTLILDGGTMTNTGADVDGGNKQFTGGLSLTADSKITTTSKIAFVNAGYAAQTFDFGGHVLTKDGSNMLSFINTTIKNGTLRVTEGSFTAGTANFSADYKQITLGNGAKIEIIENGAMNAKITSMAAGTALKLEGAGTFAASSGVTAGTQSAVTISGSVGAADDKATISVAAGNAVTYSNTDAGALNADITISGDGSSFTQSGANGSGQLGSAAVAVKNGGTLALGSNRWTLGTNNSLSLDGGNITGTSQNSSQGNLDFTSAQTVSAGNAFGKGSTISASIRLSADVTFDVAENAALNITGRIGNGAADAKIIKTGAGTLTLDIASDAGTLTETFSGGIDVNAGKVVVKHAGALGTGTTTVAANATLGLVAGVTVTDVTGGIELAEAAKIVVDMLSKASETETFVLELVSGTALKYNSISVDADNVEKLLGGAIELKNWEKTGWKQSLSYANNTLALTMTVPEPSAFGLLAGLGALALAGTRRRRKKA